MKNSAPQVAANQEQREPTAEEKIQALNNMCLALEQQRNEALNRLAAQNITVEQLKQALQQAQAQLAANKA